MRGTGHMVCAGIAAGLLALAPGCKDSTAKGKGITLHFAFSDAKGIQKGARVMGDGVDVGRVCASPYSPKPKYVVVPALIERLEPEKMRYVTADLTATIKKDNLVSGQLYLDLIFPKEPGETVADGTTLRGRDGAGNLLDITDITIPKDPRQFLEMLSGAFVAADPAVDGKLTFYLNWASLIVAALVLVVLILDFLIRLPQSRERERSSPLVLREVWMLFCVMLVARLFVAVVRALGGMGVIGNDLLRVMNIGASSLEGLLAQEWPFWVLAIVLITFRFKFDLLTRVRKG